MAWFNSILGGGAGNSNPYVSPAAVPSGMLSATAATGTILQSNSAQNYWTSNPAQNINTMEHLGKIQSLNSYANVIGWTLTHHHIPVGVTSDDPKIAILKITSVGEVLKDVGVRTSDTDYYVMREPSE
jgi:hypothetical protein